MKYKILKPDKIPTVLQDCPVVQDVPKAVECLVENKVTIARYEYGNSMMPILRSGQFCKIRPLDIGEQAEVGDALFCYVNGYVGTHMVLTKSNIDPNRTWYLIGMTNMQPLGWTSMVFGIATAMDVLVEEPVVEEQETNHSEASE